MSDSPFNTTSGPTAPPTAMDLLAQCKADKLLLESRLREAEQEKMVAVEIRRWAFKWMKKAEAECDQLREQYKALDRDFNECDSERDRLREQWANREKLSSVFRERDQLQEELREVKDDRDTLWAEREELAEAVDERDRLREQVKELVGSANYEVLSDLTHERDRLRAEVADLKDELAEEMGTDDESARLREELDDMGFRGYRMEAERDRLRTALRLKGEALRECQDAVSRLRLERTSDE